MVVSAFPSVTQSRLGRLLEARKTSVASLFRNAVGIPYWRWRM